MNVKLSNICELTHKIAKFRRLLKKYDGETSYIKERIITFQKESQELLSDFLIHCPENFSWVERVEQGLKIVDPSLYVTTDQAISLEDAARDLYFLIRSQFNMFEQHSRNDQQTKDRVAGVILGTDSYWPDADDEMEFDHNDIDAIILLSDHSGVNSYRFENIGVCDTKTYTVSQRDCKKYGITSPATCYVAYH